MFALRNAQLRARADSDLADLVALAQSGDAPARNELFECLRVRLGGLVDRMMAHSALAPEDAMQDVLLKILLALPSFDPDRGVKFTTWSYVIAANHCRQLRRQQTTRLAILTHEPDLEHLCHDPEHERALDRVAFAELRSRLGDAVDQLAASHREILGMRVEQRMSYRAISKRLGISLGTVKSRLNRARALLKGLLVGFDLDEVRAAS